MKKNNFFITGLLLMALGYFFIILRKINYTDLLGVLPDFLWTISIIFIIYSQIKKINILMLVPLIVVIIIEIAQYVFDLINFDVIKIIKYWPGVADINDIYASLIATIIGYIVILIFKKEK